MNTVPFELSACIISLFALIYGIISIIKYEMPMYFKIITAASGCYVMEELWVVANTVFGNYSSFISVRLFGIFGFFCFLLCANAGEIDRIVDDGNIKNRKARIVALVAPALLLIFSLIGFVCKFGGDGLFIVLLALIVFAPTFAASYYSLKHLLLKNDDMGFLDCVRELDIISLVIYAFNLIYLINLPEDLMIISYIADIVLALLVFILIIFSVKGGKKWKTLL